MICYWSIPSINCLPTLSVYFGFRQNPCLEMKKISSTILLYHVKTLQWKCQKKSEFIMKSTRKKNPNKTTPIKLHTSYMDPRSWSRSCSISKQSAAKHGTISWKYTVRRDYPRPAICYDSLCVLFTTKKSCNNMQRLKVIVTEKQN